MCNPPFYSDQIDLEKQAEEIKKRGKANSINTGKQHELIYDNGGEVGFIKKLIDESLIVKTKIK